MGGYGSTRWEWQATRAITDEFLRLDVRALAGRGYFTAGPGEVATGIDAWICDGEDVGRIGVGYHGDDPHVVTLEYHVHRSHEDGQTIPERIGLDQTPCTLGGVRRWFVCPGCARRRMMLFCVGGVFRCRVCHRLAYRSMREEPVSDRGQLRSGSSDDM
jgi:hypothetical protein